MPEGVHKYTGIQPIGIRFKVRKRKKVGIGVVGVYHWDEEVQTLRVIQI